MPYGSDAPRLRALKANFGTSRLTGAPAILYVCLRRHATDPATVLGTEPDSTGGYARVAVDNLDASFTFTATGLSNAAEIRWPAATAEYSITDPLNQWVITDNSALGSGEIIAFGALTTPIDVTGAGDVPVIAAGALVLGQAA